MTRQFEGRTFCLKGTYESKVNRRWPDGRIPVKS